MDSTADGLKPIKTVEVGGAVWTRNNETGELALKPVARTFRKTSHTLVELTAGGETLITTREHPFCLNGHGWIRAGEINILDRWSPRK